MTGVLRFIGNSLLLILLDLRELESSFVEGYTIQHVKEKSFDLVNQTRLDPHVSNCVLLRKHAVFSLDMSESQES